MRLGFHRSRSAVPATRPVQDEVPEARGEAFYLGFDPLGHVEGRAVGDVAVGPDGVLALGGAGRVEEALLGEQDERPLGVLAPRYGGLPTPRPRRACRRGGPCRHACSPSASHGIGTVEREVHLEDAGSVAVAFEGAAVAFGEVLAGDVEELKRRHVEEYRAGPRHVVDRTDQRVRVDFAAQ